MGNKGKPLIFAIGAFGYGLIEIIWRGHTHWSMGIAGGLSFLGMGSIYKNMKKCALWIKAIAGSALITGIELVFGFVFNILLKKNIWDYSRLPLNLSGQICARYSFFWMLLSLVFIPLAGFISKKIENKR